MTGPVNQHHVPKVYLKHFSCGKKEEFYTYTWDKSTKKIFRTNIENVASERHFYTVNKLEDIYAWENFYAQVIEPLMDETISNVIKISESCLLQDKVQILNDELKVELAIIMVCQLLRGKHSREYIRKIFDEKSPQILADAKVKFMGKISKETDSTLEKFQFDDDLFKASAMEAVLNPERIGVLANMLVNRCWIIYKIEGEMEFITSDNPVMFMDKRSLNVTPFHNGMKNNNTVIFYPISSKLLITLYDVRVFGGIMNSYDGKLVYIDSIKDSKFINNTNKKQIEQCNRQVFSKTEKLLRELI